VILEPYVNIVPNKDNNQVLSRLYWPVRLVRWVSMTWSTISTVKLLKLPRVLPCIKVLQSVFSTAYLNSVSSLGYGMDGFTPAGPCSVAVGNKAFVSVKASTPGSFSLSPNQYPPTVTAGFICEKESKNLSSFLRLPGTLLRVGGRALLVRYYVQYGPRIMSSHWPWAWP